MVSLNGVDLSIFTLWAFSDDSDQPSQLQEHSYLLLL